MVFSIIGEQNAVVISCCLYGQNSAVALIDTLLMWSQEVGSTVCVNPGRMAKGQVGGTYARMSVSRRADSVHNEEAAPSVVGQIIRIWTELNLQQLLTCW